MTFDNPHSVLTIGLDSVPGPPENGVGNQCTVRPIRVWGRALTPNMMANAAAGHTQSGIGAGSVGVEIIPFSFDVSGQGSQCMTGIENGQLECL